MLTAHLVNVRNAESSLRFRLLPHNQFTNLGKRPAAVGAARLLLPAQSTCGAPDASPASVLLPCKCKRCACSGLQHAGSQK